MADGRRMDDAPGRQGKVQQGRLQGLLRRRDGMALPMVLVIVGALAVFTVGLALDHAVEMRIAGNRKAAETAFRNAEAGLAVAQHRLAQRFGTDPINLQRLRTGSAALPDWDFLFTGVTPYIGPNSRTELYDEIKIDLGMDHLFKVFGRLPEDRKDRAFADLWGDNTRLVLRSVGFGPAGAEQETEMMVEAAAEPAASASYAQEGMGSIPSYVNMRDRDAVAVTGSTLATVR